MRHPGPDPVGRGIDPAFLRVAHDHDVVGADEAAAVVLVQPRHRELVEVDLVVALHVLQHRAGLHHPRRNRAVQLHAVAIGAHHVHRRARLGKAERQRQAPRRIGGAAEHAETLRITRHLVDQEGADLAALVGECFRQPAHLQVPVHALGMHQLAGLLRSGRGTRAGRRAGVVMAQPKRRCLWRNIEHSSPIGAWRDWYRT